MAPLSFAARARLTYLLSGIRPTFVRRLHHGTGIYRHRRRWGARPYLLTCRQHEDAASIAAEVGPACSLHRCRTGWQLHLYLGIHPTRESALQAIWQAAPVIRLVRAGH